MRWRNHIFKVMVCYIYIYINWETFCFSKLFILVFVEKPGLIDMGPEDVMMLSPALFSLKDMPENIVYEALFLCLAMLFI